MLRPQADHVRELMGVVDPTSTAERKAASKAAKASYAAELQAQMRANEEAKQRERAERMGLVRPPPLQAPQAQVPYGAGSPGVAPKDSSQGGGLPSYGSAPPPYAPAPVYSPTGPPGAPGLAAPAGPWSQPPPYQPAPPGPSPFQQPAYQPSVAAPQPFAGSFGMPSPGYSASPPAQYMPPGAAGGYGPPPQALNYASSGGYGPPAAPPLQALPQPPLLPGPVPPGGLGPNTMRRMEQQAKKDQYRLELEAQIREREERKAAEKARRMEEDMRKEAEMAVYAMHGGMGGGRGGGGAPLRDAAGNIVANLGQLNRVNSGMGPGSPGRMGGMGMGGGPPDFGMGGGPMGGPPPGMGMGMGGMPPPGMGMGGMPPPGMGGGPPMGMGMGMGGPPGMGGGGPMEGGPPGVMPNFRFRSDNAYLTPGELDNKQRQARELQEALEQQIQEKRRAKELEKQREIQEIAREEARFQANAGPQAANAAADAGGRSRDSKEVVVDAWEKARLEAEEARRNKFAAKRGAGGAAPSAGGGGDGGPWGDGGGGFGGGFGGGGGGGGPGYAPEPPPPPPPPPLTQPLQPPPMPPPPPPPMPMPPPPPLFPQDPLLPLGGGSALLDALPRATATTLPPATPLVVEKVRQVAAAELAAVKQELAAEAAQLREVVAAQGQQVAALKSHAERLEAEAERARGHVAAMRVGMLQRALSGAGFAPQPEEPEPLMRAMADYDRVVLTGAQAAAAPAAAPPPALVDIGLDLPPTAVELRRQAGPPPMFDMGPVIPPMNSAALMMDNIAASAINASAANGAAAAGAAASDGGNGRPLTSGLRTINPLEASMAAESVFIFPNGREMGRYTNAAAARGQPMPSTTNMPTAISPVQPAASAGPSSGGGVSGGGALPFQSLHMTTGVGSAVGEMPMVATTQELETGPVPQTPLDRSMAQSAGGALLGALGTTHPAPPPLEPQDSSGGGAAGALGGGAAPRRQASGRRRSAVAMDPLEVDLMLSRNQDKLALLKSMTDLPGGATSIEALDEFLSRYAAQRPGLPERTATPVLRINTPDLELGRPSDGPGLATATAAAPFFAYPSATAGARASTQSQDAAAAGSSAQLPDAAIAGKTASEAQPQTAADRPPSQPNSRPTSQSRSRPPSQPTAVPIYSSRSNSEGPLPMGGGRVLSTGGGGSGNGRAAAGSLPGTPDKPGTLAMTRRNSFTGERPPQEGVLSQHFEPLLVGSRPASGAGGLGSTGSGLRNASPRPPMLPNTRYSSSGAGAGNGNPSTGGNPGSTGGAAGRAESGSRAGSAVGGRPPIPSHTPLATSSRPVSGVLAGGDTERRTQTRSVRRPSRELIDDSGLADSSTFPSYSPSAAGSPGQGRPLLLSRSRSLNATNGGGKGPGGGGDGLEPLPAPPPEDSLDVELRKVLSMSGQQGGRSGSQAGGQRQAGEGAAEPQFQIPRSPLLSGAARPGSISGQRGITGVSGGGTGAAGVAASN
ncbi:hypothetical protein Agub_g5020 [Astrephomene gubernaculifera]|uniref:Uncharacterized protein n=1 Tax=Astrephomene gubernaculifera TaxID=47775 RepID=A0AAD3DQ72_9CHLO|nr:hypothetical protein Agub_g5020 [Astrephomene gubernaculifera]